MSKKTQTIQQTSKNLKLQIILSVLLIVIGLTALIINPITVVFSAAVVFGGVVWYAVTKFRIWWNHG